MGVQVSIINGVDKIKLGDGEVRYRFPEATAYANNLTIAGGTIEIYPKDDYRGRLSFRFADLDNNQGTTNAEGFLDWMAGQGFFQSTGTVQETNPSAQDYSTLTGMKLPLVDMVNMSFDSNTGYAEFQFADAELQSADVVQSYVFTVQSGDYAGLKLKQILVSDSPTSDNLIQEIKPITDAILASRLNSSSGKVIKFRMKGYNNSGDWLHPERNLIELNDSDQPEDFGFAGVSGYDSSRYYAPIYLEPNVMVGTGCAWIQQFEMPANLADGLGPGTPDEFAVGGNVAQGIRGLVSPIFPESQNSPFFFEYLTKNAANNYALQARWQQYDGVTKSTGWNIYKEIDNSKAYLRVMFVLGRSGATNYNKGTGYWWCLDLSDSSVQNLLSNIASISVNSIPDADYVRQNIHLDEYIAVEEEGAATEEYEIMGSILPNWYWDAYQASSYRTEQLSTKNGGVMPEMNVIRHPVYSWFLFRNDTDYTTEDPALDPKEFFRMLVKNLKTHL